MSTTYNPATNYFSLQNSIDKILEQCDTYTRLGDSFFCQKGKKWTVIVKTNPKRDR